jgi:hypothetical protein
MLARRLTSPLPSCRPCEGFTRPQVASSAPGFARATAFSGQPTASCPHLFCGVLGATFFQARATAFNSRATALKRRWYVGSGSTGLHLLRVCCMPPLKYLAQTVHPLLTADNSRLDTGVASLVLHLMSLSGDAVSMCAPVSRHSGCAFDCRYVDGSTALA